MGKVDDDDLHTRRSKGTTTARRSAGISQGSKRGSHARTSHGRGSKTAAASQSRIPSPPTNRPRIPTWGSKRARTAIGDPWWLPAPPSPTDPIPSPSSWRDWANISDDPAGLIAERLLADDVVDYLSFRAACRPWRLCCSIDPREHGVLDDRRFHPRQWVMLRTEGGRRYRRRFMSVTTGSCRHVALPELRGHDVFGLTSEGLLVLLHRATYVVRLLNPFTGQAAVDLPPATTLMSQWDLETRRRNRDKFLEISGAGLADGDSTTVAVHFADILTLAVARPGDASWTVDHGHDLSQAMSFAGRFYCATREAVMVVEIRADGQPPRLAIAVELPRLLSSVMMDTVHLVDNGGELTLVDRKRNGTLGPREYKVYRVDMDARKVVHVRGLGGRAAFIGWERALCVSPSVFPSVSGDTIYLGYDDLLTGEMDDSPIDLVHGTSEPRLSDGEGVTPICGHSGVDHYFSRCVTSYRHHYGLRDRC
ncbi:hypothetical protein HU200_051647 [Digitaria exilis]|uniref:KIB1-4 beta-propeller domain-containing protein n=1 Tax=Digitaria exilis TaxID=1010633 RepID=A0A835AQC4_9POAL|nr:hypothetical protein HU200_051647 [Digitaria exilis]CAB3454705.1 unnamed protein product [Digitaria exilis]